MKKLPFSFLLLCLWLTGCTTHSKPGIEGYVVKKESGRILVVASKSEDFSSTGGLKEFYPAIWFSHASNKADIGDKVQIWFDVVMESYPGQAEAEKVLVLPSKKPKDADLTESDAIRKALASKEFILSNVPAVKSVTYQSKTDHWEITIHSGESEVMVQIKD
ncbi:YobA family protein [Neobacillus sedimentimangrovi]|uniref:YobA family protein n=1 Tax=Neobacillus sedimentimangrovi TaxID=2699460 RepID=A0ABS8QJB8_9BACI|nr:YobA family protein [Neobacillus sedimentimangrovi]MCD4839223.1 YobA family protein [Neobacillus sedimentimangrovi]